MSIHLTYSFIIYTDFATYILQHMYTLQYKQYFPIGIPYNTLTIHKVHITLHKIHKTAVTKHLLLRVTVIYIIEDIVGIISFGIRD